MTYYTTDSWNDFASYKVPAFPRARARRLVLSAIAIGSGSLAAAWTITALAAAWMAAASVTTHLSVYEKAPIVPLRSFAPRKKALGSPYGTLAGLAGVFPLASDLLDSDHRAHFASLPFAPKRARPAEAIASTQVVRPAAPATAALPLPPVRPAMNAPAPQQTASLAPLPPLRPTALRTEPETASQSAPLPPSDLFPRTHVWARREIARPVRRQGRTRLAAAVTPTAAARPAPAAPNPFQMLFDALKKPANPALAYARSEDAGIGQPSIFGGPVSLPAAGSRTAVYDIAAHTVYLPDGERLEAHSGMGREIDDPRFVNVKDRGATPPHLYDLRLRRRLFHGVRALRLTPVGAGAMYGRIGLLAHSFMLGARGDSNGCVVFRNYPKFLQAYLSGQVTQLVVVPHLQKGYRYASNSL